MSLRLKNECFSFMDYSAAVMKEMRGLKVSKDQHNIEHGKLNSIRDAIESAHREWRSLLNSRHAVAEAEDAFIHESIEEEETLLQKEMLRNEQLKRELADLQQRSILGDDFVNELQITQPEVVESSNDLLPVETNVTISKTVVEVRKCINFYCNRNI